MLLKHLNPYSENVVCRKTARIIQLYHKLGLKGLLQRISRFAGWSLKSHESQLVVSVIGHEMHLNPSDTGLSRELFLYRIHEPLTTYVLQKELRQQMIVIDIGANIGYYTLIIAKAIGSEGEVLAVEPDPVSVNFLSKNISINGYQNVKIKQIAVGDHNGSATLYRFKHANWNSLIASSDSAEAVEVPCLTLDSLIQSRKKVDLVRMDIEGYECDVIENASWVLQELKPKLCIEIHTPIVGADRVQNMLAILENNGYTAKYLIPRDKDLYAYGALTDIKYDVPIAELLKDKGITQATKFYTILFEARK